jgi:hypothetical protein
VSDRIYWESFEAGALAALDYITDGREDLADLAMLVAEKIGADIEAATRHLRMVDGA